MSNQKIFTEISSGKLLLREESTGLVNMLFSPEGKEMPDKKMKLRSIYSIVDKRCYFPDESPSDECDDLDESNPFNSFEENSVVVFPIIGMMLKYDQYCWGWRCGIGMDSIADLIRKADESKRVVGIILLINTPGGSTQSVIQLEDALKNCKTPKYALVDGQCCSGGIYAASFCDKILATNRMCEIGSIGTFATMMDDTGYYEEIWKIKVVSVYPPESKFKNLGVREALEGDSKRLIDESLSPFAQHFQTIIKTNRPKLNTDVEGILEGKVFYAYDAINNGLIDGYANLDQAVRELQEINSINQIFN